MPSQEQNHAIAILNSNRKLKIEISFGFLHKLSVVPAYPMGSHSGNSIPILLAEDDDNDVFLMQRAFTKAGLANPLLAVRNGEEAIAYLNGTGLYTDRLRFPLPCLILTDLKMPRANGFDFLGWLSQQAHLRHLPAIVMAASNQPGDRQRAAELGAAAYWVKTLDLDDLMNIVSAICHTWIADSSQVVRLPGSQI